MTIGKILFELTVTNYRMLVPALFGLMTAAFKSNHVKKEARVLTYTVGTGMFILLGRNCKNYFQSSTVKSVLFNQKHLFYLLVGVTAHSLGNLFGAPINCDGRHGARQAMVDQHCLTQGAYTLW